MTVIVDCGSGNLRSVLKAFEKFTPQVQVSDDPAVVARANRLVLPGQGAFGSAVRHLTDRRLLEPIKAFIAGGKPFLGICMGMQLLFDESEEKGIHRGLSVMKGKVVKFSEGQKIPQIGWNQVSLCGESPLFRGIPDNAYFYFVHSYYVAPSQGSQVAAGVTRHGIEYVSAVSKDNVFGVQFHPEKSQRLGLKIIENFCKT